MQKGVLFLALVALFACTVADATGDDMDTSFLAMEDRLHDTPVRQSQRQFLKERLAGARFAQTGTQQRGFFNKLKKVAKAAGGVLKQVAVGAVKGALKGGTAGALLGGVKAGLKALASKGGRIGKAIAGQVKNVAKNVGKGIQAGARLVNMVNNIEQRAYGQVGPTFGGVPSRPQPPRTPGAPLPPRVPKPPRRPGPKYGLLGADGYGKERFKSPSPLPPPHPPIVNAYPDQGAGRFNRAAKFYGRNVVPRMNRLSGVASALPEEEQACVVCQYLVQRTSMDFAAFNAAAGGKKGDEKKEGGDESEFLAIKSKIAPINEKTHLEAVLLQMEDNEEEVEEEEQTEEEEGEEQADEEEASEEEEEGEEQAEESENEEVSLLSTSSGTGLSSAEQQELTDVLEETHDEALADAVDAAVAGNPFSMFNNKISETDLANEEIDESLLQITDEEKEELVEALQKSDAIVTELHRSGLNDLSESEKKELASLLDEEVEMETETYLTPKMVESAEASSDNSGFSFLETSTKTKNYARLLYKAEEKTPTPDFITTSFLSLGGVTRDSFEQAEAQRTIQPTTPRRFRLNDVLAHRPGWNRFDPTVAPHPNPERQKARIMFQHMLQYTYDRLEGYCSTRLPEQMFPYCSPLLRSYRLIAEGIRYGDRPDQICMRGNFCPKGSYVRGNTHSVYSHGTMV